MVIGAGSVGTFTETQFVGNQGSAGGAILAYQGSFLTVNRCTFSQNQVLCPPPASLFDVYLSLDGML